MKEINIKPTEICGQFELLVIQNRIGKFSISDALIEQSLGEIMKTIFTRVFITRAEHLYNRREIEYVGYCDLFVPNKAGCRAPEYQFTFHKQLDGTLLIDVQMKWNEWTPNQEFFKELKRVSKHQIIWGANYYV